MSKIKAKTLSFDHAEITIFLENGVPVSMEFDTFKTFGLTPSQIRELYAFMTVNHTSLAREPVTAGITTAKNLISNTFSEYAESNLLARPTNKKLVEFLSEYSDIPKAEIVRFDTEEIFSDIVNGSISMAEMDTITHGLIGPNAVWQVDSAGHGSVYDGSGKTDVDVDKEVPKEPTRAWFLALLEAFIIKNGGEL